jgi:hypothetical protein
MRARAMKFEGFPDWTKEDEYPNKDKTKIDQWAWEFLRRWPKYRDFWAQKVEPFISADGRRICRDADGNWWPHLDESISQFSVDLPSPPQSSTPPRTLFRAGHLLLRTTGGSFNGFNSKSTKLQSL